MVTGAAQGTGREVALRLAREGARLASWTVPTSSRRCGRRQAPRLNIAADLGLRRRGRGGRANADALADQRQIGEREHLLTFRDAHLSDEDRAARRYSAATEAARKSSPSYLGALTAPAVNARPSSNIFLRRSAKRTNGAPSMMSWSTLIFK